MLAVRIRNILAEYPVTNLIKELLQNADDARATHVKVIKYRLNRSGTHQGTAHH